MPWFSGIHRDSCEMDQWVQIARNWSGELGTGKIRWREKNQRDINNLVFDIKENDESEIGFGKGSEGDIMC